MPVFVHNNASSATALMEAAQLNNQANQLGARGDLTGAEKLFLQSLKLKIETIDDFDAACTRDNLGQLWEIKGDMVKAKAARERDPNSIVCSNFNCSLSSANVKSERENLKNCARCKATWYCSAQCQKVDWRSRHKKWCKEPQKLSAEQTSTSG